MELTAKYLVDLCRKDGLYATPELNDRLYTHYKGIAAIPPGVLTPYTGLRVLWLEGNGLSRIENLGTLAQLRTLYLHENSIDVIEGLEGCPALDTLNLSKNSIRRVGGLGHLHELRTLLLEGNALATADDVEHLRLVPSLTCVDLQGNRLADGEGVLRVLEALPQLAVLYLAGNPLAASMPHYRKIVIARLPRLAYLDDRPVFTDERGRCEAWWRVFAASGDAAAAAAAERTEAERQRVAAAAEDERQRAGFDEFVRAAAASAAATVEEVPAAAAAATTTTTAMTTTTTAGWRGTLTNHAPAPLPPPRKFLHASVPGAASGASASLTRAGGDEAGTMNCEAEPHCAPPRPTARDGEEADAGAVELLFEHLAACPSVADGAHSAPVAASTDVDALD